MKFSITHYWDAVRYCDYRFFAHRVVVHTPGLRICQCCQNVRLLVGLLLFANKGQAGQESTDFSGATLGPFLELRV